MSPRHEAVAGVVGTAGEVLQVAGVGQEVEVHDALVGRRGQQPADVVGADEAGAAGDEDAHGRISPFGGRPRARPGRCGPGRRPRRAAPWPGRPPAGMSRRCSRRRRQAAARPTAAVAPLPTSSGQSGRAARTARRSAGSAAAPVAGPVTIRASARPRRRRSRRLLGQRALDQRPRVLDPQVGQDAHRLGAQFPAQAQGVPGAPGQRTLVGDRGPHVDVDAHEARAGGRGDAQGRRGVVAQDVHPQGQVRMPGRHRPDQGGQGRHRIGRHLLRVETARRGSSRSSPRRSRLRPGRRRRPGRPRAPAPDRPPSGGCPAGAAGGSCRWRRRAPRPGVRRGSTWCGSIAADRALGTGKPAPGPIADCPGPHRVLCLGPS